MTQFNLTGAVLAFGLVLSGCSMNARSVYQEGVQYGAHVVVCTPIPEIMDKLKEGLSQNKVCLRSANDLLIVPKDYPLDRL